MILTSLKEEKLANKSQDYVGFIFKCLLAVKLGIIYFHHCNHRCSWGSRLQTVASLRVERWRAMSSARLPESCAKRSRTEGKAFGWLAYTGCAHTHTAHWACCYYANRVITHALPIQQTPPLLVLINQHNPRLCYTQNKHWRMHMCIQRLTSSALPCASLELQLK